MKKLLNPDWLPTLQSGALEAIVIHWTGGNRKCSLRDRTHYHFIIDGTCTVIKGIFSVASNARPFKRRTGYAAHALNFNAGAIGVSICGMAGAKESPFNAGGFPITEDQWDTAVQVVAELCIKYSIPVTEKTVLQHGEIQKNTGVTQRGKWDCCKLPWLPTKSSGQVCAEFRALVRERIAQIKAAAAPVVLPPKPTKRLFIQVGTKRAEVKGATKTAGVWTCEGSALADAIAATGAGRFGFAGTKSLRQLLTDWNFTVLGGSTPEAGDELVVVKRLSR